MTAPSFRLHGWADREFVTAGHGAVVTTNGLFRATALVNGRVAATWSLSDGTVTLSPLEPLSRAELDDLRSEALDVLRFLQMPERSLVIRPGPGYVGQDTLAEL